MQLYMSRIFNVLLSIVSLRIFIISISKLWHDVYLLKPVQYSLLQTFYVLFGRTMFEYLFMEFHLRDIGKILWSSVFYKRVDAI